VPISTTRLKAVLEWLRCGRRCRFRTAWGHRGAEVARRQTGMEVVQMDSAHASVSAGVQGHQPALARPAARVRVTPRRTRRAAGAGARPSRPRFDHDDGAL